MRYGYIDENNEDIIAYYKREGECHYVIVYLSGFCEEYDSIDQKEEQYIIEKMIEQAKNRDELCFSEDGKKVKNNIGINIKVVGSFICSVLSGTAAVSAINDKNITINGVGLSFILLGAVNFSYFIDQISRRHELIKYHRFLEMLKEDEELLQATINETLKEYYGTDLIYYPPIVDKEGPQRCINLLDFMPNSLVKTISKKYDKLKNKKK
jgi:hypothetical protein